MSEQRERPAVGDVRMSYTMQPCGTDGSWINGGNHYANAWTAEGAREFAVRVLTRAGGEYLGYTLSAVDVYGREMRLGHAGWTPVKGGRSDSFTVTRAEVGLPPVLVHPRGEQRCWDSIALDYFETVHVMLTDGSCVCGDPTRNVRGR